MTFEVGNKHGKGRPPGARQTLSEAFLNDLVDDWKESGKVTIAAARAENPLEYIKVIAGILPKEAKVDVSGTVTHKSEPVSELDGLLREAIATGQMGQNKEPLPN